jgi:uncharacterized protein YggE
VTGQEVSLMVAAMFLMTLLAVDAPPVYAPPFNPEVYTIETDGVATVDIPPNYVEFWLHLRAQGADVTEAVNKALGFEPQLRKLLMDKDLVPSDLMFTGMAVPDLEAREAHISARVRFKATFAGEEGPKAFAVLCDAISAIATTLGAQPKGPALGIDDTSSVQDTAIKRAIEKAYSPAEASARIMNAQIISVSKVNVQGITWNDAPEFPSTQPELARLNCTARVRVTYMFSR